MSVEVVAALGASVLSVVLVIWQGGRQVGKVESAIGRLSKLEGALEAVPALVVKVDTLTEFTTRLSSDHRALRDTTTETSMAVAEIRGRLQSVHD